jgi:hypothetical protein
MVSEPMPERRHEELPKPLVQVTAFPEASALEPAETVTLAMFAGL